VVTRASLFAEIDGYDHWTLRLIRDTRVTLVFPLKRPGPVFPGFPFQGCFKSFFRKPLPEIFHPNY
jgi:hypothetical protein